MASVILVIAALFAQGGECRAILERGAAHYESRNFVQAVAEFTHARETCADDAVALLPLAQAQLMSQRLPESLETLDRLLRLQPANVDAQKLRGDVLYLLGREEEAKQALETARKLQPGHEATIYALGRIYYQQNRLDESAKLFQELIAKDETNYRAHDNLALSYAALQQDENAIRHFLKALDLVHKKHPDYDVVYANFANFMLDRSEFEKAFQLAAEAAKRNPLSARNFFLTGKALVKLEKPELSIRWLKESARLDPTYTEPHYWLAQVYRKLGRQEEANQEFAIFRELSKAPKLTR